MRASRLQLPSDVYHDSACFSIEVNEDPEWVQYCSKNGADPSDCPAASSAVLRAHVLRQVS